MPVNCYTVSEVPVEEMDELKDASVLLLLPKERWISLCCYIFVKIVVFYSFAVILLAFTVNAKAMQCGIQDIPL